ncbi:hypothetical protein [Orgyia leucostigma nucleopolyhedrovirus]|uniref:Uncharacterized protein n=1 Tax=Orgyia leucostigma nucleopolyhedrovirus TaxID=490711 RepID=B0FDZ9_9ABAC|nr:hypothetical protein [Orgyia leucostigma nucleopolyhedrovirus]ABY65857.1 hypothetical protein [Orgyia leucostigma nucleopolyhedrovirus]
MNMLIVIFLVLMLARSSYNQLIMNLTSVNANSGNDNDDKATNDIDTLFTVIMEEINKIQKNEITDYGYTRMIFIVLILFFIFSIKAKLYKILTCFKKKVKHEEGALETITIRELNYNVNH